MRNPMERISCLTLPLLLTTCGPLIMPATEVVEPAQRVARLEEAHRVDKLQRVRETAAAIERYAAPVLPRQRHAHLRDASVWIARAAERFDLDPYLVTAVILTESWFNPTVISYAGAVGLMQVLPYVGRDVAHRHGIAWDSWTTLKDPRRNILIGTAYLAELIDRFHGRVDLALAAYNMGPTLLQARMATGWRPNGPYVRKVTSHYRNLLDARMFESQLAAVYHSYLDSPEG